MSKINQLYQYSTRRWGKIPVILGMAIILSAITTVIALALFVIDLTTPLAVVSYHQGIFAQIPPERSAGTGNYDPFLSIGQANAAIVRGYNTDAPPQFNESAV